MRKPMIYSCLLTIILSWGGIFANGWRSGAALQTPRYGATSVVMDGYIYVIGGATANGQILNSVERYDSSTQTWDATAIAPTQIPRLDAVAMIVDGKIYLMGGYTADGEVTDAEAQRVAKELDDVAAVVLAAKELMLRQAKAGEGRG